MIRSGLLLALAAIAVLLVAAGAQADTGQSALPSLLTHKSRVHGGTADLSLSCPAGGADCNGWLHLTVRAGVLSIDGGTTAYSIAAGQSQFVPALVNRKARAALKRRHRLPTTVMLSTFLPPPVPPGSEYSFSKILLKR